MLVFCEILLCVLAAVGTVYLCRDLWRSLMCRRLKDAPFVLWTTPEHLGNEKNTERALLEASVFLTRAGVRHLIRGVCIKNAAPSQMKNLYEAACRFCLKLDCCSDEEISLLWEDRS